MTSPRASTVLSRFPRHLALDLPGTLFGEVVDGLAGHLDRLLADLGRVRTAHRLGQVTEQADLLLLAALHGFRDDLFEPCVRRIAAAGQLGRDLVATPALRDAALAALPDLLALPAELWPAAAPESADAVAARMSAAITAMARNAATIERLRGVVTDLIAVHRQGNGSPGALLRAAAALLAFKPGVLQRSSDDYWHLLAAEDRLRPLGGTTPRGDLLALEENPEKDVSIEPAPRRHRDLFSVSRLGFGPVATDVTVTARADRCFWPMVVDIDAGHALLYAAPLAAGQVVRFRASGMVEVDGVEAGNFGLALDGGVYADDAAAHALDFVFGDLADAAAYGDRVACYTVCHPVADALASPLPHGGGLSPPIHLRVGPTRLRFFVREAAFGSEDEGVDRAALPIFCAGVFDASLAADAADEIAADVGFDWRERQAYTCTLWLPRRFAALDGAGQIAIRERIRLALDRFRPAGIYLAVDYADDRWTLGDGVLRDADSVQAEGLISHGTSLWTTPIPEPAPV